MKTSKWISVIGSLFISSFGLLNILRNKRGYEIEYITLGVITE